MDGRMRVTFYHLTVGLPSQKSHHAVERSRVLNVKEMPSLE
jgi:hypothetical protein